MNVFNSRHTLRRGFIANLKLVLFQPGEFFFSLRSINSQQWLIAALLILGLIAFAEVRQSMTDIPSATDSGIIQDGGVPMDGGLSPDMGNPLQVTQSDPTATWMTGLTAIGRQIIQWAMLALLLCEVTLFNGYAPNLSKNLQIVIWASVPIAMLAWVQIIFMMGGGQISNPGFTGLLIEWERYSGLNIYIRSLIHAAAGQMNLFWLWSLVLVAIGARKTLNGKRSVVMLVVAVWIAILGLSYGYQSYQTLGQSDEDMVPEFTETDTMPPQGDSISLDGILPDADIPDIETAGGEPPHAIMEPQ